MHRLICHTKDQWSMALWGTDCENNPAGMVQNFTPCVPVRTTPVISFIIIFLLENS